MPLFTSEIQRRRQLEHRPQCTVWPSVRLQENVSSRCSTGSLRARYQATISVLVMFQNGLSTHTGCPDMRVRNVDMSANAIRLLSRVWSPLTPMHHTVSARL